MKQENALSLIHRGDLDHARKGQAVRVLGIDLGTTNSTISECVWEIGGDGPEAHCLEVVQPTLDGEYTHVLLPSVVAIHTRGVFVGEGAKRLRSRASELNLKQNQSLFYECKNDIGNRKTYHRAPAGFQSAAQVGGKVLDFLYRAAMDSGERKPDRAVVTVPASFQAAQRRDTIEAARLAGISLAGGDLLDEPVAAFLDYLLTHRTELASKFKQPRTLVVFDFGGGTCDVAVFRLHGATMDRGPINMESLAASRYHRLGGGDIDAAIVHEVLIPELCRQNDVAPIDLTFEDKKVQIEPALLGLAEMLKVGLCIETRRLISFGKYAGADKQQIVKTQPGVHHCRLGDRTLQLSSPKLTAAQFEELLKPFLDQDLLFARETEYRLTCSIFAPLQDALDRAGLDRKEVDFCLMVGGSSLIPQVLEAVKAFFPKGETLTYADRDDAKACVSRGAAYHALALALFGKGLVQPVCHDEIAIRTTSGLVTLVPKGVGLPYPSDGSWACCEALAVPRTVLIGSCELRVELVAAAEQRALVSAVWPIPGPVNEGEPIRLEYCLDENQVLALAVQLKNDPDRGRFEATVENPLTNVVNPNPKRMQIEEMEEELRLGKFAKDAMPERLAKIAGLYMELGQGEKSIAFLQRAIRAKGNPDVYLLNRLAEYYGKIGDVEREEKVYRQAAGVSPWNGSWFNLSLALRRRGKLPEAADAIEQAIKLDGEPPCLVLAALIAEKRGDAARSKELLSEAMAAFDPIRSLDDWQLGWYVTAAQTLADDAKLPAARAEQKRRAKAGATPAEAGGELPIVKPGTLRPI